MNSKYKPIFIISFLIIFFCNQVFSQEPNTELTQKVMFVPQFLITNGVRIDYERKVEPKRWIVISPYIYYKASEYNASGTPKTTLAGAGLELGHKIVLGKSKNHNLQYYYGYSALYQRFRINRNGDLWKTYIEDGNPIMKLSNEDYKLDINKMGLNLFIGAQVDRADNLYLDIFMGFGLRYSIRNEPYGLNLTNDELNFDYYYTGTIFLIGFKLGLGR
jgi:hypothetical protein